MRKQTKRSNPGQPGSNSYTAFLPAPNAHWNSHFQVEPQVPGNLHKPPGHGSSSGEMTGATWPTQHQLSLCLKVSYVNKTNSQDLL